jgi:hypothetical protein
MAKPQRYDESSRQQSGNRPAEGNDGSTDLQMDRARTMRIAGEEDPHRLQREIEKLDAETDEEVDALRINLEQDSEFGTTSDGTGRLVDDLAEQKIAGSTEVGPLAGERGAASIAPGREDTSRTLRLHHPNTEIARAEDVVEGNLDEPQDESTIVRKVDEGTAA